MMHNPSQTLSPLELLALIREHARFGESLSAAEKRRTSQSNRQADALRRQQLTALLMQEAKTLAATGDGVFRTPLEETEPEKAAGQPEDLLKENLMENEEENCDGEDQLISVTGAPLAEEEDSPPAAARRKARALFGNS